MNIAQPFFRGWDGFFSMIGIIKGFVGWINFIFVSLLLSVLLFPVLLLFLNSIMYRKYFRKISSFVCIPYAFLFYADKPESIHWKYSTFLLLSYFSHILWRNCIYDFDVSVDRMTSFRFDPLRILFCNFLRNKKDGSEGLWTEIFKYFAWTAQNSYYLR